MCGALADPNLLFLAFSRSKNQCIELLFSLPVSVPNLLDTPLFRWLIMILGHHQKGVPFSLSSKKITYDALIIQNG